MLTEAQKKARHFQRLANIKVTAKPRECDCVYCTNGPRRPQGLLLNACLSKPTFWEIT